MYASKVVNSKCKLILDLDENTSMKQSLLRFMSYQGFCLFKIQTGSEQNRGEYLWDKLTRAISCTLHYLRLSK